MSRSVFAKLACDPRQFVLPGLVAALLGLPTAALADFTCRNNADCFDVANQCDPGRTPCNDGICNPDSPEADNIGCVLIPNDDKCDDGLACTLDVCSRDHGCNDPVPLVCDDDIPCTVDRCDEDEGGCVNEPRNARCSNGIFCDGRERCDPEEGCVEGRPRRCGDGVPCTIDVCDETNDRCTHTPNNTVCNNGLFCDGTATCDPDDGCTPVVLPNCNDNIPCTNDSCNEATDSCTNTPNDGLCTDGQHCNGVEFCSPTQGCRAGPPPNCSDNVACTTDACVEANDTCTHTPNNGNCSNGLFCDGNEICSPTLGCQPGTPPNCGDSVACTNDRCSESSDSCINTPDDDNCANGDFCDGNETCDPNLGCRPGNSPNCADNLPCTIDQCVEATNSCSHTPSNEFCDDDVFCDGLEVCDPLLGCRDGTPPNCADGVICTTDICVEATETCQHTPNDGLCQNDLFCDGAEVCDPNEGCEAGPPRNCNDNVDCTIDACIEEANMCFNTPSTQFCSNGQFCDGIEFCHPTQGCQPGTDVICDDDLDCTTDSCNEGVNHCFFVPNGELCGNDVVDVECGEQCDEEPVVGEICNNDIDDDGDGFIDCADADCLLIPFPVCTNDCKLVPPCTPLRNDPALIAFTPDSGDAAATSDEPAGTPKGLFSFHARLFPTTPLDLVKERFLVTLSNANGEIYRAELAPSMLRAKGKRYRFFAEDRALVAEQGGIAKLSVQRKYYGDELGYAFRVQAYGDFTRATLATMTTQAYFGDDVGYVTATWTGEPGRWVLRQKDYDDGVP